MIVQPLQKIIYFCCFLLFPRLTAFSGLVAKLLMWFVSSGGKVEAGANADIKYSSLLKIISYELQIRMSIQPCRANPACVCVV